MSNNETLAEIRNLCIDIYAHSFLDSEITLCGNGTNASEASNIADAIIKIIHGDHINWEIEHSKQIDERIEELKEMYGGYDEEEEED